MGRERYFIQEAAWEGLQELCEQGIALKSVLEAAAGSRQCSSLFSCVNMKENPQSFLMFPLLLDLSVTRFCEITNLDLQGCVGKE